MGVATAICPWDSFEPTTLHFCEASLCTWIRTPANAWSNVAQLGVGIWILTRRNRPHSAVMGSVGVAIGLMSFAYHSTLLFSTEVMDLGSMFLFASLMIVFNLRRLRWVGEGTGWILYAAINAAAVALMALRSSGGLLIFGALIGIALALEMLLYLRRDPAPYRTLGAALGIFVVALGIWTLDQRGILCDPRNHWIQGHAIWHVLSAVVYGLVFLFYSGISLDPVSPPDSEIY